jgi:hypothetical protein
MPLSTLIMLIAIGLCAGLITGVIGGSGVSVVVPILTVFMGFPIIVAIGTSLFVDIVASLVASFTYHQHGNVDLSRGLGMALAAVIGAQFGSLIAFSTSQSGLGLFFAAFLIINGSYILKTGMKQITERASGFAKRRLYAGEDQSAKKRRAISISVLFGFGIGIISGFVGAGGGVMFLLVMLLVLGYEPHIAIGTSTLIMAITATSGATSYYLHGNLDVVAALIISAGTLLSSRAGAVGANKLGQDALGRVIALIFIVLGIIVLLNSIKI